MVTGQNIFVKKEHGHGKDMEKIINITIDSSPINIKILLKYPN